MRGFLHHLFFPREDNNYRAKLLHHKLLFLIILFILSMGVFTSAVKTHYPSVLGISSNISLDQLLSDTNQKRQENGLPPLSMNSELGQAAAAKASDMFAKNYWAHNSPDGTTPWVFIRNAGYNYVYAGENLARGFTNSSDVINAWMASPEHRENMLSSKYADVGFAVATGNLTGEDTVLVVEELGSRNFVASTQNSQKTVESPTVTPEIPTVTPEPVTVTPAPVPVTPEVTPAPKTVTPPNNYSQLVLEAAQNNKPLINSAVFTSNLAKGVAGLFILVLILDMLVIERRKIVRFVGHNLDHIIYLSFILVLLFLLARGFVI